MNGLPSLFFRTREFPTSAIYFSASMADLIGAPGQESRPIWRLSPNVFHIRGDRDYVLVIRNWDRAARRRLARLPKAELRYLLDDDIWAGAEDALLPTPYRRRLAAMADGPVRELLQTSGKVYVSSSRIAGRMSGKETTHVRPALVEPIAALDHHGKPGPTRMIFAGTASHLPDLAAIATDLAAALRRDRTLELHTFLGGKAPKELMLPNAFHRPAISWAGYREAMRRERFHVALGPCLPTAFNDARSPNKILEYASFGAAPIFGRDYPYLGEIEARESALVCPMQAGAWIEAVERLAADGSRTAWLAEKNADLALSIGAPSQQRAFWSREFAL